MQEDDCVRVFYAFARSGGTLLNKCLGSHPDNVIFSEINPAGSVVPAEVQAVKWFGLLKEGEAEEMRGLPYHGQIAFLQERCRSLGKTLIIRDWVTVNFLPGANPLVAPSGTLEQDYYLQGHFPEIKRLVVSRRARAVYASIRASFDQCAYLSEDDFATAYLAYVQAVHKFPVIHLEDIRTSPEACIRSACDILDSGYEADFRDRFHAYGKCTGNNTLKTPQQSSLADDILESGETEKNGFAGDSAIELCARADYLFGYDE